MGGDPYAFDGHVPKVAVGCQPGGVSNYNASSDVKLV